MKRKCSATVLSRRELAPSIYEMWIETSLAGTAAPGQFIGVYPRDKSTLLPRPISICEVGEAGKTLRIVYRTAGAGTAEFAGYGAGEKISLLGVLGNGFPLEEARGRVLLMGGGIGIPPLLELTKRLSGSGSQDGAAVTAWDTAAAPDSSGTPGIRRVSAVLGYRDANTFLREDFERYCGVCVATEDGSVGVRGNVLDAARENGPEADVIFACGPMPMLRGVKAFARERGIRAYISLEEHMACGVGACLGCVVKTEGIDPHSHVHNARICTEGPVFDAEAVQL